jgi:hypothetical protein
VLALHCMKHAEAEIDFSFSYSSLLVSWRAVSTSCKDNHSFHEAYRRYNLDVVSSLPYVYYSTVNVVVSSSPPPSLDLPSHLAIEICHSTNQTLSLSELDRHILPRRDRLTEQSRSPQLLFALCPETCDPIRRHQRIVSAHNSTLSF